MNNPLMTGVSQPGEFIKLPSNGHFYENPPMLNADGELEVKPMNAMAELQLKNPDGLLNNESMYNVIKECVPGIPNPHEIISPDLEMIMVALRVATYGKDIELEATCPECNETSTYTLDLTAMLGTMKHVDHNAHVTVNGYKAKLRPMTLKSQQRVMDYRLQTERLAYSIQRKLESEESNSVTDDALNLLRTEFNEKVKQAASESFMILADGIESVETPPRDETDEDGNTLTVKGEIVTDRNHIKEWLDSIAAPDSTRIKNEIEKISQDTMDKNFNFKCSNCEHESKMEVELNPANFFATNSSVQ